MDLERQNQIAWLILAIAVTLFSVLLYAQSTVKQIVNTEIEWQEPNPVTSPTTSEAVINKPASVTATPLPDFISSSTPANIYDNQDIINGTNNTYNVTGTKTPVITIVEFGDFTCPHCRASFPIIRSISVKYRDYVQFIYRDRTPSERSIGLALTAHCAGEQDHFWQMHDLLYQNQSDTLGESPNDPQILALINKVNLDSEKFYECLKELRYLNKIKINTMHSERLGSSGTPTWFINGQIFQGELDQANIEAYLNSILDELGLALPL